MGYRGPAAETLVERWNGSDRPFVLRSWETVRSAAADGVSVDCVVVETDTDTDVSRWIDEIQDRVGSVPIIVVTVGQLPALDAVAPDGATSQFTVPPDVDRVELLSELASLVDEHVTTRREQSILDSLLANVPMSVYVKDRKGRHVAVSDALLDMIGPPYIENPEGKRHHHPDDIVGKTDFDLYSSGLAAESTEDQQAVIETGESVEQRVQASYGEHGVGTTVMSTKVPWYDRNGAIVGTVGVTQDITERKQYERQLQRQNERLRRLATMVSHDIRNPLSVAMGRLEVARETDETDQFAAVERALDRIDALVADIITVMRQGEPATDLDHVPLAEIARDVWANHECDGATLQVSTDARIYVDPGRLRLLLDHLFANAIEHGRDGTDDITITVGALSDDEGFFVADDGIGIPADQHEAVFQPGLSGSDTSTLGLALIATIADAHNWTIELTDNEDGGARFEFHGVRHFEA
ncbi:MULTISPECIES: PAS domain-containing sensor histidine kinase [unclassified Halorhabdus]|uniref:sensor histidine kinase n=1 Tax=unclassified Halorhabdus TaxID=2621901 RepID=UPI0023DA6303|nr:MULTISPECIES: PAS domain-containing sensor histidine kinase [unclassified Halorhabdus]WEL18524.1 Signal transduction histidine kinase [Halorhabdus sp. SVX81]WEL22413.1 Signal transduction histidine kinase, contains REC and PAS domains [Halorhabdus sp. BNX81]